MSLTLKSIFLFAVLRPVTTGLCLLSFFLLLPFFSSVNAAVLGILLKIFWNLCPSFTGNSFHFCFLFFLFDGFQEEEKTEIMVILEAPIRKYKIFIEVNIQVLNWFSQALSRHFRVEIEK